MKTITSTIIALSIAAGMSFAAQAPASTTTPAPATQPAATAKVAKKHAAKKPVKPADSATTTSAKPAATTPSK